MSLLRSIILLCLVIMFSCNKQEKVYDYDISPVNIDKVKITGGMWAELVTRNREKRAAGCGIEKC